LLRKIHSSFSALASSRDRTVRTQPDEVAVEMQFGRLLYKFHKPQDQTYRSRSITSDYNDDEIDGSRTDDEAEAGDLDDNKYDGDVC
jgi:predicted molibdopterin-dependent oxidoreductase YjgC